jgi:cobalamin biosynthesis protein CobT
MAEAAREEKKRREEEKAKEEAKKEPKEEEDSDEGEAGDSDEEDSAEGEDSEGDSATPSPDEEPEDEADGAAASDDEGEPGEEDDKDGAPGTPSDMDDKELAEAEALADSVDEDADKADLTDYTKDEMAERAREDAAEHSRYVPDPRVQARDRWIKPLADERRYSALRDMVQPQIGAMKAKLLTLFRVRAESHHVGDQERGAIDTASLYSLRLGNKRVFSTRTKADELSTAVSIVIDLSGSMGDGGKIECATQMAIALGETLAALNMPFEIIGFHNPGAGSVSPSAGFARYFPFEFNVYKSFNESYRATRARLGSIRPGEQNVDGEAVLLCAQRLYERPEARKLMFVLSDGEPAGGCDHTAAVKHLKDVVAMVANSGIEVFGIGAMAGHVSRFYPNNIVVKDISALAVEVYKLVRTALSKNLTRGAA